jgi:flavodoxin
MKTCVLYCSHTGNTKRFAEAIAELLKAPIFDVVTSEPSVAADFELLIIGTPVVGLRPAPEVSYFVKRLPECKGKRTIVFCTYAVRMGGALKVLEKELAEKGCVNLLGVSKRVLRKSKADFSDILAEIKKVVEEQARHTE